MGLGLFLKVNHKINELDVETELGYKDYFS